MGRSRRGGDFHRDSDEPSKRAAGKAGPDRHAACRVVYVAESAAGFADEPNAKQLTWQVGDLAMGEVITGTFQARMQGLALGETVINTVTAAARRWPWG